MAVLNQEIALYEELRVDLERNHNGAWALIHQDKIIGIYPSYEAADAETASRYGREPCRIRKVGENPFPLPAAVRLNPSAQSRPQANPFPICGG